MVNNNNNLYVVVDDDGGLSNVDGGDSLMAQEPAQEPAQELAYVDPAVCIMIEPAQELLHDFMQEAVNGMTDVNGMTKHSTNR